MVHEDMAWTVPGTENIESQRAETEFLVLEYAIRTSCMSLCLRFTLSAAIRGPRKTTHLFTAWGAKPGKI